MPLREPPGVLSVNEVGANDRAELAKMLLKNVTRWKDGREIALGKVGG
jgi:hypothetical protein